METETIEVLSSRIIINEFPDKREEFGTGATVWGAAKVLLKYLEYNRTKLKINQKKILELGAGCGMLGIGLSILEADVVMTDLPQLLPLMKNNVAVNKSALIGNLKLLPLSWGEKLESFDRGDFNLIVGSDIVYQEQFLEPLFKTLMEMATPATAIYISLEKRSLTCHNGFLELAKDNFIVKKIPLKNYHRDYVDDWVEIYLLKLRRQ